MAGNEHLDSAAEDAKGVALALDVEPALAGDGRSDHVNVAANEIHAALDARATAPSTTLDAMEQSRMDHYERHFHSGGWRQPREW